MAKTPNLNLELTTEEATLFKDWWKAINGQGSGSNKSNMQLIDEAFGNIQASSNIVARAGEHIGDVGTPTVTVTKETDPQSGEPVTVLTFNYLKGATGANGQNGQDGLTTKIEVNNVEYTQVDGKITLPNYPSTGTTVIANPTLVGTESDLTGLQVDGVKYKVPSGGSGESSGLGFGWNLMNLQNNYYLNVDKLLKVFVKAFGTIDFDSLTAGTKISFGIGLYEQNLVSSTETTPILFSIELYEPSNSELGVILYNKKNEVVYQDNGAVFLNGVNIYYMIYRLINESLLIGPYVNNVLNFNGSYNYDESIYKPLLFVEGKYRGGSTYKSYYPLSTNNFQEIVDCFDSSKTQIETDFIFKGTEVVDTIEKGNYRLNMSKFKTFLVNLGIDLTTEVELDTSYEFYITQTIGPNQDTVGWYLFSMFIWSGETSETDIQAKIYGVDEEIIGDTEMLPFGATLEDLIDEFPIVLESPLTTDPTWQDNSIYMSVLIFNGEVKTFSKQDLLACFDEITE